MPCLVSSCCSLVRFFGVLLSRLEVLTIAIATLSLARSEVDWIDWRSRETPWSASHNSFVAVVVRCTERWRCTVAGASGVAGGAGEVASEGTSSLGTAASPQQHAMRLQMCVRRGFQSALAREGHEHGA